jgi:hypothetical protein
MSHPTLTLPEHERLELLIEEAAEVIQAATKILRHGYDSYNPDDPDHPGNLVQLQAEIGHFLAACDRMFIEEDISSEAVFNARTAKLKDGHKYLHYQAKYKSNEELIFRASTKNPK